MEIDIEAKNKMTTLRGMIKQIALERKILLDEQRRYRIELYKLKKKFKNEEKKL